jgi:hypothetical protein
MGPQMSLAPAQTAKPSHLALLLWSGFIAVALAGIFYLPQLLPVPPSISDSYFVGYSNRAGVLLLLFFLVLGGYLCRSIEFRSHDASFSERVPREKVWLWVAIFSAGWVLVYFLAQGLQGFAESVYLIDRLKMLAEGGTPYKDFEYAYGAVFLYGPRALMLLHLSAEDSYYVFWLFTLLAGVWMLAEVIGLLEYPGARKSEAFSLLCLSALPAVLSAGVNYTLFRFLPAAYLGLLVQRMDERGQERHGATAMLMAVGSTVILLLVSAEVALAFTAGVIGYFTLFGFRREETKGWRYWTRYALFVFAEAGVLWLAGRLGLFNTLKAFGGGAYNFPIVPGGHILFFFFCCGLVTLYAANRLRTGARGGGMLMVLAVSIVTLFAALGRCDVWHVGFEGIGVLVVATLLVSARSKVWRSYRIAFVVLFVAAPALTALWWYQAALISKVAFLRLSRSDPHSFVTAKLDRAAEQYFARKESPAKARLKTDLLRASGSVPTQIDLRSIYPGASEVLDAPFGYKPNQFGEYRTAELDSGYFFGLLNAFTHTAVMTKIDELRAHPERDLLLPEDFTEQCTVHPAAERRLLQVVFMSPLVPPVKHRDSVWEPLCTYITTHYQVIQPAQSDDYGYELWRRSWVPKG